MPPKLLVDLGGIDLTQVAIPIEEIREVNPQRYEMEQLSGIITYRPDLDYVVGFRDIGPDEFWVRGHIPGRPLFPGVLMIEAAAQLSSFYYKLFVGKDDPHFVGFGGVTDVKFRRTVDPGDRLIIIALCRELKSRRAVFDTQEVVGDRLVFEGTIIGMPVGEVPAPPPASPAPGRREGAQG
jgi:3-hydroxyacyl-[acyl-carrier-protein] dehydratase